LAVVAVVFGLTKTARAQCPDFAGITTEIVTYYGPFRTNAQDPRADPDNPAHRIQLKGWLYYDSTGPVKDAPVLIFNHGHEKTRPEQCSIPRYFVKKGYVVFSPLRRGHDASGFRSTGIHLDDYKSACMRSQKEAQADGGNMEHLFCSSTYCRQDVSCDANHKDNAVDLYYLRSQHIDVQQQINYIKSRAAIGTTGKLADPARIALIGHSYGGAMTIFANEHDYGQSVAIDVSGGELSWGNGNPEGEPNNPYWEIDLRDAMQNQQRPMYFMQPKNGRSLEPTLDLFGVAIARKYRSQAAIFPAVPWVLPEDCLTGQDCWDDDSGAPKPEYKQAHENFLGRSQIKIWGGSVLDFMKRYPR
jgi:pimeloyl-ACP methyl ester carboxylesterase